MRKKLYYVVSVQSKHWYTELKSLAKEKGTKGYTKLSKEEIIKLLEEE